MFSKIKKMTNTEIKNRINEIDNVMYSNIDLIDNLINLWNEQTQLIYELTVIRGFSY